MDTLILDLSFLEEVSENDASYIHEVLSLFLESVPDKIQELNRLVKTGNDFEAIRQLAHFLKSSANIVRVRDMYDGLARMEILAKQHTGKEEIVAIMNAMMENFNEAMPLILAEQQRSGPQQ